MSTHSNVFFITAAMLSVHLVSSPLLAAEKTLTVKLQSIQKITSQEKGSDELYISVTEFPKEGNPRNYQVPSFPTHWLSSHLDNVKDVILWEQQLRSCTDMKVVFSLVEEDTPPWNLDDLLGSVIVEFTCDQGKMVSNWIIPNNSSTFRLKENDAEFSFKGDRSEYHLIFKLDQK